LLASVLGGAGAALSGGAPAEAVLPQFKTSEEQYVDVPQNSKPGLRSYEFTKPAGFKRLANPIDPTGLIFRSPKDSDYAFALRAEMRQNATPFTPSIFIDDYRSKFVNSTGSSFLLIKGGSEEPDRVDKSLGVKYYDVEYVIRTQMGFSFDSLRSLHFLTTFAATEDSLYVLNCQTKDDNWEKESAPFRQVVSTFKVTS